MNDALAADFDVAAYDHVAFYDPERAWIEMRLRARRDQVATVPGAGVELALRRGDEIRTEISCKYTPESFGARLSGTGLRAEAWYQDEDGLFAIAVLRRG